MSGFLRMDLLVRPNDPRRSTFIANRAHTLIEEFAAGEPDDLGNRSGIVHPNPETHFSLAPDLYEILKNLAREALEFDFHLEDDGMEHITIRLTPAAFDSQIDKKKVYFPDMAVTTNPLGDGRPVPPLVMPDLRLLTAREWARIRFDNLGKERT